MERLLYIICSYLFILSITINCIDNIKSKSKKEIETLDVELVKTYQINYKKNYFFQFETQNEKAKTTNDLIVHFHSINCNIKVKVNKDNKYKELKKYKDEIFYYTIENNRIGNTTFEINAIADIIDGNYRYNYTNRTCLVVANSVYNGTNQLRLEKNQITKVHFDKEIDQYEFIYFINRTIEKNDFIAFSFLFNKKSKFQIHISNILNNTYEDSTFIYLDYNTLSKIDENGRCIEISIKNINKRHPVILTFKAIKNDTISVLQKYYLNQGFITSNNQFQYYYMEIFKGEEGEIILHNKRLNGKIFISIKPKKEIENVEDRVNYLIENENNLKFDEYTQKLPFYFSNTSICQEGCYMFITYLHESIRYTEPIVGYEYTLLVRVWDELDYSPPILNIPFNEYIFGSFDLELIDHHYYSIFIPKEAEKIIIQIEGNFIDGFFGEGRKKLYTLSNKNNIINFNITKNKMLINYKIGKSEVIKKGNYISFAFRPKNYFKDFFSFYYFRIFYLKKGEKLIYPLDSNIGNICKPLKDKSQGIYYCDFLLKNDYNLFSLGYSITDFNQIEIYKIKYTETCYDTNNKNEIKNVTKYSKSIYFFGNNSNLISILFRFEFYDNEIKNIISTFKDDNYKIFPSIYSAQLYMLNNINKTFFFNTSVPSSLTFRWVNGKGILEYSPDESPKMSLNINFKGKPFSFSNMDKNQITFKNNENLIFYLKLNYKQNDLKEIINGESMSEFMDSSNRLYYYIKYNNQYDFNNIYFRFILNDYNLKKPNFIIGGHIVGENDFKRLLKGEFIQLENNIEGRYNKAYKNGLLQIKKTDIISYNEDSIYYVLIDLDIMPKQKKKALVEIISLTHKNYCFILPINQYITGSFNQKQKTHNYSIQLYEEYLGEIFIEFTYNYEEIKLVFDQSIVQDITYSAGAQKYRIINNKNNNLEINLNVVNEKNIENAYYAIRYYYTDKSKEIQYKFDKNSIKYQKIKENNDGKVDISFEFDNIKVYKNDNLLLENNTGNVFDYYCSFYSKDKKKPNELLNTTTVTLSKPDYISNTTALFNDTKINFTISNMTSNSEDNFVFELQIKIHAQLKEYLFNEEFLVFTSSLDLNDILKKEKEKVGKDIKLIIIIVSFCSLILIIIILFLICYFKVYKSNKNLKEKVEFISFSLGVDAKDIQDNGENVKRDEDYETAFI